jgi:hypothetical protein
LQVARAGDQLLGIAGRIVESGNARGIAWHPKVGDGGVDDVVGSLVPAGMEGRPVEGQQALGQVGVIFQKSVDLGRTLGTLVPILSPGSFRDALRVTLPGMEQPATVGLQVL